MANSITLAKDDGGNAIQTLAPRDATTAIGTSTGTAVLLALPAGAQVVEVACSNSIHWQFGTSAVVATTSNKYQNQGSLVYDIPDGATHMSFIAAAGVATATCSVTELY